MLYNIGLWKHFPFAGWTASPSRKRPVGQFR